MELDESFREITGYFWYTEEEAIKAAKEYSSSKNGASHYAGKYCSYVKGIPDDPTCPEQCFAITNKYDPRVRTYMKQLNEVKQ